LDVASGSVRGYFSEKIKNQTKQAEKPFVQSEEWLFSLISDRKNVV
jgi:hypothetical protein